MAKASKNLGLKNVRRVSRARSPGPIYIRGRSVRRASSKRRSTSSPSAGSPSSTCSKDNGQNCCFEVHPGEDIFDGETFEMFLERVKGHKACNILFDPSHFVLQQLDYLAYIDIYNDRIKMFHVKDAEFRPTGKQGVYSGYASWVNRAGRFRSLGDGQVDFNGIFSQVRRLRFRRLGGARMGVRAQASRGWRARRLGVHQEAHHPRDREGVRRLRGRRRQLGRTEDAGAQVMRPLRWGMIGGGEGAFIGAVHRMAARLDGRYQLVAGVFSSDAEKTQALGGRARRGPGARLSYGRGHDRRARPSAPTASKWCRSSRRTTCTTRSRRRASKRASTSSATSRSPPILPTPKSW